jgi:signal transduction histidine kinase
MTDLRDREAKLMLTESMLSLEQDKRREQDRFMTMLTHELTNTLTTAQLALGTLSTESSMRARGYRAIESMRDIIRRCAQSSAIEAEASTPKITAVNVHALLAKTCEELADSASIHLNVHSGIPLCQSDPKLLGIIMDNLLDNAIKYRATSSIIHVTAETHVRDGVAGFRVSVSNDVGPAGRPDPEKIFSKYWRGPDATRYAGSGLGLYLCAQIAGHLKGKLRYQPAEDQVRFELWLPL